MNAHASSLASYIGKAGLNSGVKKILLAVLIAGLAAGVSARDLDEVRGRGTLRVLASDDESPLWLWWKDEGDPGFEREVLTGFARLNKLKLELVPVAKWEDAIPSLLAGKGDLLAGINATDGRARQIDFSDELLPAKNVVVTRAPHAPVRSAVELQDERVAVTPNTTPWWEAVTTADVPASRTVRVDDAVLASALLKDGKATATVLDMVDFYFERRHDRALEKGHDPKRAAQQLVGRAQVGSHAAQCAQRLSEGSARQPGVEPADRQVFR
jgi:ABC-type amino acid transport substrate-binding protein